MVAHAQNFLDTSPSQKRKSQSSRPVGPLSTFSDILVLNHYTTPYISVLEVLAPSPNTALGISTMTFNLSGFNFNQSVVDSSGRVIKILKTLETKHVSFEISTTKKTYFLALVSIDCIFE